jgi:selenide,water dikinase
LQALLSHLPKVTDPNLIVGYDTHDDAGVYRLTDDIAIVATADFITPPFDDPVLFGKIGAANSLSDVYAMGGRPVTCVNLVGFPSKKLGADVLAGIILGAQETIVEAGAVLVGGHTVEDREPKFGLAVTGVVHPQRCWTNSGVRDGDALVLTKPIGSGVLLNANLKGWVSSDHLADVTESLVTLNKIAAEVAGSDDFEIHAATDVTGFGLAGHGLEMARGSSVRLDICYDDVPVFEGAEAIYIRGMTTGSNGSNRQTTEPDIEFVHPLTTSQEEILFDPQTNGGLLFALPHQQAAALVDKLQEAGVSAAVCIGTAVAYDRGPYLRFF